MAIRLDGDWEGWLKFFLRGVALTASEASSTAQKIFDLRERHRRLVIDRKITSNGLDLLALLYRRPLVTVSLVANELNISYQTANVLVGRFENLGLLQETTGARRGRVFRYGSYLKLFAEPIPTAPAESVSAATIA